uniref:Disease resistance protein RPM1 n=3 Tax=Triticum urartu TaxID=4572 RepID=A0A8R7TBF2_TRIUA
MGSLAGKLDGLLDAELKAEFGKLTTRLLELSKSPDPPETARIWMKDVRELSYDMNNCVDAQEDWEAEIPEFMARVKEANGRYERYVPESLTGPADLVPIGVGDHQHRTVSGGRKSDPVVGLHDEGGAVYKLTQLLTDDGKEFMVVSIVGGGGIGKTTLAKQLWREKKLEGFDCRAFVRTARKPDMRRILRSILAQVRPHQPPDANGVHELIQDLTEHLQNKRYFLIIDDLWATSVWHVVRRAFPEGNGSRIVTTTENQDVALACCSYESQYMFKMERLSLSHSKELFISAVFGSGEQHSRQLDGVSNEIIRRCAGLPQAIISICSVVATLGEANAEQNREKIQNNLPTNATSDEILKQVLIFCYNCLPSCLQTCLLYLSIYPENYIILKEVIMKQWVGEAFICAPRENEKMKVAESYFDKLVHMGMIQQIDVGYSDEILYYAVHHMVHDIITTKSIEENFVTVIDYSQRTVRFSNKVRRLSLQFGSATYATSPESIGLSEIQSLAFIGLKSCYYSSILEFKVLRVLILHIWADEPSTGVDLKPTSELVLLRSLQVTCNDTVHLPDLMQGPKHLETLEINARVAAIPANIVHLRSWLHLRLGVGIEVPDLTGTLKTVTTLNPPISLDDSSCSCKSVKTMELLLPICRIPKWIGQLANLCILKFVVRQLQRDDISNLRNLSFLSVLLLHVQQPTTGLIGFAPGAFPALEYFEFRCGVLRLMFQEGTMPNLERLKLGFNAYPRDGFLLVGVEDLLSIKEISGVIGLTAGAVESDFMVAESAFRKAMGRHPNVSIERADMVEELYVEAEKQHEIPGQPPSISSEQ